jgi:predicted CoA-binding protein
MSQRVVIVGASDKPERYAHQAMRSLLQHGHQVVLVHPRLKTIDGHSVHATLSEISGAVDTVTLYVNASLSTPMLTGLIALHPRRVLFNPGTENPDLAAALNQAQIQTEEACTLVLLATGAF